MTARIQIILIALCCLVAISCGVKDEPEKLMLAGTVNGAALADYPDQPVMVALMRDGSALTPGSFTLDAIEAMVSVDTTSRSFEFDLTDSDLKEGDEIYLVAFVDVNYTEGLPDPDAGDNAGIYIDRDSYSPTVALHKGLNSGFDIAVNRLIRPNSTEISGTIIGEAAGEVLIVAYAGEITGLDFTSLNPDQVIGYSRQYKGASDKAYTIDLLPYPAGLETDTVYIVVLLDDTGRGLPAPGNLVGFHSDASGTRPEYFRVDARSASRMSGVDIHLRFPDASGALTTEVRIPEPSGDDIYLNGHVTLPDDYDENEGALFLLVAHSNDPMTIMQYPLSSLSYFTRMPKGETYFELDLSDTGLNLEDEVMVVALWDKDYTRGFPNPTQGDVIGYLGNKKEMSYYTTLSQWQDKPDLPDGWRLSVDKIIYDQEASLEFTLDESAPIVPQAGEAILVVAMTEDAIYPPDPDADYSIDMDYIVATRRFIVGQDGPPYMLNILPALYKGIDVNQYPFGLSNIFLFALLDNDSSNSLPDQTEYIGYCPQDRLPAPLAVNIQDGVNIVEQMLSFPSFNLTYGNKDDFK